VSTGATPEQIERAVDRSMAELRQIDVAGPRQDQAVLMHVAATMLVPPGHRIATPALLDVLRRVVAREREDRKHIGPFLSDDDLAALDALIGDTDAPAR
jgi:hypothetical protein